jgi:hypothetical protein
MNVSKEVILRWEKWRIGYNLMLLAEGLWLLREHLAAAFTQFWLPMGLFAIAANVCYCLGPWLEISLRVLGGLRAHRTRYQPFLMGFPYFLFWVGLAFSTWWVWMWAHLGVGYLGGSVYGE